MNWDIYVQSIEGGEPSRVTSDPKREFGPAWSPDGERIAFLSEVDPGKFTIQQVSRMGGTKSALTPADVFATGSGIDWSPDGKLIAFTIFRNASGSRSLALLSLETGHVRLLTQPPPGPDADRLPRFSPDGQTVAFCRLPEGDLYTVAVASGAERRITSGDIAEWGHDWTADGKELVFSSDRSGQTTLWRIRADAAESEPRPVTGVGAGAQYPSVARTNSRLAYHEVLGGDADIWRVPVTLGENSSTPSIGTPFPLQASTRMDASPQVSRDGKRLVFVSRRSGDQAIWVSDIDGGQAQEIARVPGSTAGSPRWSPTGTRVAFDAAANVFVVGAQGIPRAVALTTGAGENVTPSWSGDEKWIYFASNRTGRLQVWKVSADGGKEVPVTKDGGFAPFESRDERFIYYVKGREEGGIWRVPVGGGEETRVIDGPTPRFWGYWSLLENGIWFATQEPDRRSHALIHYFDFGSSRSINVGYLDTYAIGLYPFFAMTPDGKSIVYVKSKPDTSDIILVKNFR